MPIFITDHTQRRKQLEIQTFAMGEAMSIVDTDADQDGSGDHDYNLDGNCDVPSKVNVHVHYN